MMLIRKRYNVASFVHKFCLFSKNLRHQHFVAYSLWGKQGRINAPGNVLEREICRCIYGKTRRAYFQWDQILYLPCSLTVQINP